jgi:hypothetical protein
MPAHGATRWRPGSRFEGDGVSRGDLRYAVTVLAAALLISSCAGDEQQRQRARPSPQETTSTGTTSPAGGALETDTPANNMEGASYWPSTGGESGGSEGAADRIRGVEFEARGGYERVLVGFGSGEGAGVPRWSLEKPREGGYLRLYLPGVTSTRTAGEDLVGLVADAYYVVRQPEGGLFVDVLALGAFEYRVTELAETGQIALDFRNAPGGLTCPAVQAESTVVTQPCEAEEVAAWEPLAVEGYSRDPEGSLSVVLLDEDGAPIATEAGRAEDADGAWGYFETTVTAPSSYEGLATLRVSEQSSGGASAGVEVPVVFVAGFDE